MADIAKIAEVVVGAGKALVGDEHVTKFLCGTYADGSTRNLPDALNGEYLSPKQKHKAVKSAKKKKKAKFVL